MFEFKDWITDRSLIKELKEEVSTPSHLLKSRNLLLSKARGSIRKHLQQQLVEAIRKFNQEEFPEKPEQVV